MNPVGMDLSVSVGEFVALMNQTLEFAFPDITIQGELANFRVSKNRWVYFDLKDDEATVRFFGTVYQLPGPLEDGMLLKVRGQPRLHPQYNFSVNVVTITPAGEGSIRRAAELLQAKLQAEGLFDPVRKRALPYPPQRIGLIASKQSAAYADFTKILAARWPDIEVDLLDVQVQGEVAPSQIVSAIEQFNASAHPPEVLVLIRGGGSPEDLAAFSTEAVTRAVAASRIPTLVAIGHEVDTSLAELAADQRGSTPSNAAELLVPDRMVALKAIASQQSELAASLEGVVLRAQQKLAESVESLHTIVERKILERQKSIRLQLRLLEAINPEGVLRRGYAIAITDGRVITNAKGAKQASAFTLKFHDGEIRVVPEKGKK